ncbi:FHA domain-containing protein [Microbulbifer thermotolerans]|uniref:FHA domain-containing protein n=1 Tax=Microbulbifer thermotolerans TaxID=252514 RepID=UPI0022494DA7|nr:FHA domain-containing protein [Microbulbifer thermotolerans]MCX2794376.1 FHA domain-containing protein [Microbulbifer thermotolerans]WKT59869.1 FHA domain-containing protein [Microbulbifer thermotolerans]
MALIIEELNRANRVQARYRMDGPHFTLGRGFDNDVILEDIHADARHAEIRLGEDGRYYLRDLGSTNGTRLLGNGRNQAVGPGAVTERIIESGDLVQLGKTHLRLTHSETAVPAAVPLHSLESFFERLSRPAGAIGLLLAAALFTLLISYLGYARTYEWPVAVNLLIGSIVGLLVYAGAWAFIGRVVRHETNFFTHLSIAALGALIYTGWEWFSSLLNYNFALGRLVQVLDLAVLALLLPAMLWCACYLATNIPRIWRWGVALLLPWSFLGLGLAEKIADMDSFSEIPEISTEIKYRDLLLRTPVPMEEFIADSPALFDIPIEKNRDTPPQIETAAPDDSEDKNSLNRSIGSTTETDS